MHKQFVNINVPYTLILILPTFNLNDNGRKTANFGSLFIMDIQDSYVFNNTFPSNSRNEIDEIWCFQAWESFQRIAGGKLFVRSLLKSTACKLQRITGYHNKILSTRYTCDLFKEDSSFHGMMPNFMFFMITMLKLWHVNHV